ncbi:MAG: PEP-CTERM sorting domain-containing protein, partial [Chthoniobacterales bacterium]
AAFFPLKFTGIQSQSTATGVFGANIAGFSVAGGGVDNLFNLPANASIKVGHTDFIPGGRAFRRSSLSTSGAFLPARVSGATANGYVGLKGSHSGHLYYGWLRLKVTNNSNGIPIQMSLIAADGHPDIYGAFDRADQVDGDMFKTGSIAAVPEPSITALGGLGLLALGAAGVREMRRRRSVKA